MAKSSLKKWLILFGLVLAAVAIFYIAAQRFSVSGLLPAAEKAVSNVLDAQVEIGELSLTLSSLTLSRVSIERTHQFRLEMPVIKMRWDFDSLRRKKLAYLELESPRLVVPGEAAEAKQKPVVPVQPPLDEGVVRDATIILSGMETPLTFQRIQAHWDAREQVVFVVSAEVGEGKGIPVEVAGRVVWGESLTGVLEVVRVGTFFHLAEPASFFWHPERGWGLAAVLEAQRWDAELLSSLEAAIGQEIPELSGWGWEASSIRLDLDAAPAQVTLRAQVKKGRLQRGNRSLALTRFGADLSYQRGQWKGRGEFDLGPDGHLSWEGTYAKGACRGTLQVELSRVDPVIRFLASPSAPRVHGSLRVSGELSEGPGSRTLRFELKGPKEASALGVKGGKLYGLDAELAMTLEGDKSQGQLTFSASELAVPGATVSEPGGQARFIWQKGALALYDGALHAAWKAQKGVAGTFDTVVSGSWQSGLFSLNLDSFSLETAEYISSDGMTGIGAGQVAGRAWLSGGPESGFAAGFTARGGIRELLKEAFYADLSGVHAEMEAQGSWDPNLKRWRLDEAAVSVPGLAKVIGQGRGTLSNAKVEGGVEFSSLEKLGEAFLPAVTESLWPGGKGLRLEGRLQVPFHWSLEEDRWTLSALALAESLVLQHADMGLEMAISQGRLPLALSSDGRLGSEPRTGELVVDRFHFSLLTMLPAKVVFALRQGRYELQHPLLFDLSGGRLQLDRVVLGGFRPGLFFRTLVKVDGVDLERLSRQLEWPPFAGSLSADLGEMVLDGETLSAGGEMVVTLFGGDMKIRNLRLESPLSRYRTFHADVDFQGIDLQEVTRTFEFGEMNGIVDGGIRGLRLYGNTPSEFVASLSTRDKGKRNISVKALKNISILSQGGLSAALSRGIYRFIDFYRYRKIGFECSLKNDRFFLKGTAREGSDRTLVSGSFLPPRIVVMAPASHISFKEMLKRLKRLDRTGGEEKDASD